MSQVYYHTIPSDLEMISISPAQEAIFQHLSQISPNKFVEFITDILVLVEGHTLEDIADGLGD